MKEIIVKSQSELDVLPVDFDGRIIIKFGTPYNRAVVNLRFKYSVEARENSSVVAWGNTQVVDCTNKHDITTNGNARIVYNPRNITEYLSHYEIQQSDGKVRLYKAVHKRNGRYVSDRIGYFEYTIGETAIADGLTTDPYVDCGHGIHIAHKEWALDFGKDWRDIAILEVEADVSGIVVPLNGYGKVRTDKVLVIREVPLEECGLLGKFLAKKRCAK